VAELHAAAGPPQRLAAQVRSILERRGLSTAPVDEVAAALDLLAAYAPLGPGVDVEVDLSLARGLRYYTGLVFEMYVETADGPLQVCGGGRYDDLVRALGGREAVPACGFSYGLERIDLARQAADGERAVTTLAPRILVVGVGPADHPAALGVAAELRRLDHVAVEQDVRLRGVKAALRYADRAGCALVAIVGERERLEERVVLRDMRTRTETSVERAALLDVAGRLLGGIP
jgi:histidyl-tRNA synthetase